MANTEIKFVITFAIRDDEIIREEVKEFPLDEYEVGRPSVIDGEFILGLQKVGDQEPSYILHRRKDLISFDFEAHGNESDISSRNFRAVWSHVGADARDVELRIPIIRDIELRDNPDIEWRFQLRQDRTNNTKFRAVRVLQSGPGVIEPCVVLNEEGLDCQDPAIAIEDLARCLEFKCAS